MQILISQHLNVIGRMKRFSQKETFWKFVGVKSTCARFEAAQAIKGQPEICDRCEATQAIKGQPEICDRCEATQGHQSVNSKSNRCFTYMAICFGTSPRLQSFPILTSIEVAGTRFSLVDYVKLLGVTFDKHHYFDKYIFNICSSSYFHISALRHIRPFLTQKLPRPLPELLLVPD